MDLLDLLDVRLETMWRHDERGRIVATNRPEGGPAPRLVVSRSAAGAVWRTGPDVTDRQLADLEPLLGADDDWRTDTPAAVDDIVAALGGGEIDGGPNYRPGPSMTAPMGETVVVTPADVHMLESLMGDWVADVGSRDPVAATIVDGRAVAVCMSARVGARVHEAGVETHPDHRGRGHGLAAVAEWRVAVERRGAIPLYCTSWSNSASKRLAAAAGFEHYATDLYVR